MNSRSRESECAAEAESLSLRCPWGALIRSSCKSRGFFTGPRFCTPRAGGLRVTVQLPAALPSGVAA
jgi:hypothetical protein